MGRVEIARGDADLRRQPGVWAGRRHKPRNQTEALEGWSPVSLAYAIDRGLVKHTPLQLTAAGWRWLKRKDRVSIEAAIAEIAATQAPRPSP